MKISMKKYILPVLMVLLIVAVWSSAEFLKESSGVLPKIMTANLPFRVNPVVIGGDLAVSVSDQIGDNKTLMLPENKSFKDGYNNTDIISYSLHQPVKNESGKWVWNIDLEFAALKEKIDLVKGSIYMDIDDGKNDGSNEAFSDGEKITFSDNFRWNYMVGFDYLHEDGLLYSYESKKEYSVKVSVLSKIGVIRLSLPLVEKLNRNMNRGYMGAHIAAVGLYSPYDEGELIGIAENADRIHSGGGNNYKRLSPYYDFVAEKIDDTDNNYTKLTAVKIDDVKTAGGVDDLKNIKAELAALSKKEYESRYGKISNNEIKTAKKLSDEGEYDKAESILSNYLDDSSIANTYYGTIEARKAGMDNISISKKVSLVNSAFNFFDKAEKLVKDDNELYILLNNRIGVSTSVPDSVFGKLAAAESDLKKLLTLDLTVEEKAENYLILIDIYEKKDKIRDLRLLLSEIVIN